MTQELTLDQLKQTKEFQEFAKRNEKLAKAGVSVSYLSAEELQAFKDKRAKEEQDKKDKKEKWIQDIAKQELEHYTKWAVKNGFKIVPQK
jgi:predicted SprT family Zn-dependent metalloprotease